MTRRSAKHAASGAALVVLVGGPLDRRWYFQADLERERATATRMHRPGRVPASCLTYRPTDEWIDNPLPQYGSGRVWTYDPKAWPGKAETTAEGSDPPSDPPAASTDIRQRRCGRGGCDAWRLSLPGAAGEQWRPCWKCATADAPAGEEYAASGGPA